MSDPRNAIPDRPLNLSPDEADEFFIWSQARGRTERVSLGDLRNQQATFLALLDTPLSYVGQAGKAVKVADSELGIDFGPSNTAYSDLTDTPSDYTGQGGYSVKVKVDETGLEHVPVGGAGATTFLELTDTPPNYTDTPDTITEISPNPKTVAISLAEDKLELEYNISRSVGRGVDWNGTLALSTGWNLIAHEKSAWGSGEYTAWDAGTPTRLLAVSRGYYTMGANVVFEKLGGIATPFGLLIQPYGFGTPTSVASGYCARVEDSTTQDEFMVEITKGYHFNSNDGIELWSYCEEAGIVIDAPREGAFWFIRHAFRINGDYNS